MKTEYLEKHLSNEEMIRLLKKNAVNGERDHAHMHLKECPLCSEAFEGLKALPDLSSLQVLNAKWKLKWGIKTAPRRLDFNMLTLFTMLILTGLIFMVIIYFFFFMHDKPKTAEPAVSHPSISLNNEFKNPEHFIVNNHLSNQPIDKTVNQSLKNNSPLTGVYDEIKKPAAPLEKLPVKTIATTIPEATLQLIKGNNNDQLLNIEDFKIIDYSKVYIDNQTIMHSFSMGLSARYESTDQQNITEKDVHLKNEIVSYEKVLAGAFRNYKNGKYESAIKDFSFILTYFPNDLNARFYKALCFKDNGEYQKAIDLLIPIAQNNKLTFYQEAKWHLALCFNFINEKDNAKKLFTAIVSEGGFYKQQAELELKK